MLHRNLIALVATVSAGMAIATLAQGYILAGILWSAGAVIWAYNWKKAA